MKRAKHLPSLLPHSVLEYAPVNELGVVALFTEWATKRRMRISRIQAGFPDCIATVPTGRGSSRIRIEFEFRSSNFRQHRHKASGCDWIVCWEHNWPEVPSRLKVIELRSEFGLGANVWMMPVSQVGREDYSAHLRKRSTKFEQGWTMPRPAHVGDLVLFYHSAPLSAVGEVFRVTSEVEPGRKTWRKGHAHKKEFYADITRVARLDAPLHLSHFRQHPILKDAGFVRAGFRGRARVTEYWPFLRELIVRLNPSTRVALNKYR